MAGERTQLGDPDITDWGALEAACARHTIHVLDEAVYPRPHHRAAALSHSLIRIPPLEHSNELFGATVAVGYLQASGQPVRFTAIEAADLADHASTGQVEVCALAGALKEWTART
ncbi:fic family toxin-antitoxin system, toxin component [Streptomyces chartreusis]|uniref:fic family toxin-antitoxin system, toxin component n=1 Tax=Streptomyces chartreusis TaxID=1969 RepID=UPI003D8A6A6C